MADPKNNPSPDVPDTPAVPPSAAEAQAAAEKAAQITTVEEAAVNDVKLPKIGAKVIVHAVHGPMHDITTNKPIPQSEDGVGVVVNPWIQMQIAAQKLVVV